MTIKPITSPEVAAKKLESIPDFVISSFNELIVANFNKNSNSASVRQDDVIDQIIKNGRVSHREGLEKEEIFDKRWLDVELIFERAGWVVKYYNESGYAFFTFSTKVKQSDNF